MNLKFFDKFSKKQRLEKNKPFAVLFCALSLIFLSVFSIFSANIFPATTFSATTFSANIFSNNLSKTTSQTNCLLENVSLQNVFAMQDQVVAQDDLFSISLSPTARAGCTATIKTQTVQDNLGQNITYHTVEWKDVTALHFTIRGQNTQTKTMGSYKFFMTYLKTDNLSMPISAGQAQLLQQETVNASASLYENYYTLYLDGISSSGSAYGSGNGYGLYRFTFQNIFTENLPQSEEQPQQPAIALQNTQLQAEESESSSQNQNILQNSIYIAVLPQDAKDISPKPDIRILHTTKSSQNLLNKFDFSLSDNSFAYVKAELLQWEVFGTDNSGKRYCLSEQMRQSNAAFSKFTPIYQSLGIPTGQKFSFDSKGIEGNWTVTCTIKNADGSTKLRISKDVSTSKMESSAFDVSIVIVYVLVAIMLALVVVVIVLSVQLKRARKF